ncbi:FitA-like ribbon-helix-helix domain-containing protein [Kineococcus sp. SYSU DK004]|uniref:FitA-like ribbon-helix-helix domain-containing protein n=1 Tax=Kineococcus sp. SYSU DK004 TaxID=3383125 RepID=UPI003D7D62E4
MPNTPTEDVPGEPRTVMRRRAASAGRSSQEHVVETVGGAGTPSLDEVLDRAGGRTAGDLPLREAVDAVRDDRDRRS